MLRYRNKDIHIKGKHAMIFKPEYTSYSMGEWCLYYELDIQNIDLMYELYIERSEMRSEQGEQIRCELHLNHNVKKQLLPASDNLSHYRLGFYEMESMNEIYPNFCMPRSGPIRLTISSLSRLSKDITVVVCGYVLKSESRNLIYDSVHTLVSFDTMFESFGKEISTIYLHRGVFCDNNKFNIGYTNSTSLVVLPRRDVKTSEVTIEDENVQQLFNRKQLFGSYFVLPQKEGTVQCIYVESQQAHFIKQIDIIIKSLNEPKGQVVVNTPFVYDEEANVHILQISPSNLFNVLRPSEGFMTDVIVQLLSDVHLNDTTSVCAKWKHDNLKLEEYSTNLGDNKVLTINEDQFVIHTLQN